MIAPAFDGWSPLMLAGSGSLSDARSPSCLTSTRSIRATRAHTPVMIYSDHFRCTPTAGSPSVASKRLGLFTEAETRVALFSLLADSMDLAVSDEFPRRSLVRSAFRPRLMVSWKPSSILVDAVRKFPKGVLSCLYG
jgi:hypothetical protein